MRSVILGAVLGVALAAPAMAIEVREREEYPTTPDKVWAAVGDFCSISKWHPVVAKCEIVEIDGVKHRRLTTGDGGVLLEKLTASDDAGMTYSYEIVESPLPVANYKSTFTVKEDDDGAAIVWQGTFDAKDASDEKAAEVIKGIYDAGLQNLSKQLGGG